LLNTTRNKSKYIFILNIAGVSLSYLEEFLDEILLGINILALTIVQVKKSQSIGCITEERQGKKKG
jgi:hypothetical protein